MKLVKVKAYDHFTTHQNSKDTVLVAVGELLSEDEVYLRLRTLWIDEEDWEESHHCIHSIVKSTIIERFEVDIEKRGGK